MAQNKYFILWLFIYLAVLAWSGIHPRDLFTWFLEVFPALIALVLLLWTWPRFRFTSLAYFLILVHCIILMIGGHYTYAEVPWFSWIRDFFHQSRNNYDKVGHFAQGFIPAIVAREIFIRNSVIRSRGWMNFLVVCFCLALSACYELFEWAVAVMTGASSEAFLGTQGDPWDTQSDMLFALIGAVTALLGLSRIHDRQLEGMRSN